MSFMLSGGPPFICMNPVPLATYAFPFFRWHML